MNALIADDEEPARARLARLLAAHPEVVIIGEARDGLEAVSRVEALRPDLLFLDIEMPGLTGFEVLQSVRVPLPLVIFATGYDQHALAAFEANALAYLLKPIRPDRLAQAVEHAARLNSAGDARDREGARILQAARATPKVLRQVVCRKRDRLVLVAPEQILWFQVEDGIVKARTATDTFSVNYQIGELEASLPDVFFRARREVLVNLAKIREIHPYVKSGFLLIMNDAASTQIVVSARQAHQFRERVPGL